MKRIVILVAILLTFLASAAWAQQPRGKEDDRHGKPVYYDTFNEEWLDPAKWLADGPYCWGALECGREIEDGAYAWRSGTSELTIRIQVRSLAIPF